MNSATNPSVNCTHCRGEGFPSCQCLEDDPPTPPVIEEMPERTRVEVYRDALDERDHALSLLGIIPMHPSPFARQEWRVNAEPYPTVFYALASAVREYREMHEAALQSSQQRAEQEKGDAARYRFLRDHLETDGEVDDCDMATRFYSWLKIKDENIYLPDAYGWSSIDEAIDAAITARSTKRTET